MSEAVEGIVTTVKDKELAEKVMSNVGDQINSVVNNLADKLEAPTEAVQGIAKYGFEKYAEFVSAEAIGGLIVDGLFIILSIVCAIILWKLLQNLKTSMEEEDFEWENFVPISKACICIVCFAASMIFMSVATSSIKTDLARAIAPEGAVIQDVIRSFNKKETNNV